MLRLPPTWHCPQMAIAQALNAVAIVSWSLKFNCSAMLCHNWPEKWEEGAIIYITFQGRVPKRCRLYFGLLRGLLVIIRSIFLPSLLLQILTAQGENNKFSLTLNLMDDPFIARMTLQLVKKMLIILTK